MTGEVVAILRGSAELLAGTVRRKWFGPTVAVALMALSATPSRADTQLPVQALPSASSGLRAQDQVDGANGSFVQTIPIQVPPFFGIEPKLSLSYDSKVGNGPLGMGWRVDGLSVIQRASPGRGAPTFNGADIFLLDGQELVPCASAPTAASCTASGTHTTKIESFIRVTQNSSPSNWILRRSDGTKYTYLPIATYTGDSGSYDTDFRWLLSSVIDTHGNTVTYNYACPQPPALPNQPNVVNNPECYIDTITYNQTTVTFHRETRADVYTYGLGAGLVQVNFRFNTIDIQRAGVKSRAYKFLYNFVPTGTQRRRLASVQQFGSDFTLDGTGTVTGGTSLPAITLGYSGAPTAFSSTHWTAAGQGTFGVATDWLTGDLNGDGRTDFVRKISACTAQVQLSTGTSFTQATWTITPASGTACIPPSSFTTKTWDIGDFNLDGKTDLIVYCCESTSTVSKNFSAYVYLSTGTGSHSSPSSRTWSSGTWAPSGCPA